MMTSNSTLMERAKTETIPIEKLQLNQDNVRFQHLNKIFTDKEIEKFIWGERDTKKLYNQILVAGGLHEPPLVKKTDTGFIIIEGNRRIVCLRKLHEEAHKGLLPNTPKNKYDYVECKVIPADANQTDIDLMLIILHVKSKKDWVTFNRAKLITDLHENGMSYDSLIKHVGMGKTTVIRYVDSYKATLDYGKMYFDDEEWFHKFTYFDELYKKKDLQDFREDPRNIKQFSEWVHDKKFRDVRDVRLLSKIILDKKILEQFKRYGLVGAIKYIEESDPTMNSPAFKRIKKAIETMRLLPRKELIKTAKDKSRILLLEELQTEVKRLIRDVKELSSTKD